MVGVSYTESTPMMGLRGVALMPNLLFLLGMEDTEYQYCVLYTRTRLGTRVDSSARAAFTAPNR